MDELNYRVVRANGIHFNVAEAGDGDRLALCLHGFPELAYSWRHQLPLLARDSRYGRLICAVMAVVHAQPASRPTRSRLCSRTWPR